MKKDVAERIGGIFPAPKESEARRWQEFFVQEYPKAAPDLVHWAVTELPEGFTVFAMPTSHRKKVRTVNMLERRKKEIKRRTRVATILPNVESCLRLVTAVAMEISDDWEGSGRKYLPTLERRGKRKRKGIYGKDVALSRPLFDNHFRPGWNHFRVIWLDKWRRLPSC